MGVHDRDWWKEKYDQIRYDPKQFRQSRKQLRSSAEHRPAVDGKSKNGSGEAFALKVATVVLLLIVAVVACLHKSRLI